MSKISKELMSRAGIVSKLRLGSKLPKGGVKSTGAHRVKLISDKIVRLLDPQTSKETEYVRYIFEENGEEKRYDTRVKDKTGQLSYLIQRLSEIDEGQEIILEMKKQGIKNYIEVTPLSESHEVGVEEEEIDETVTGGTAVIE